MLGDRIGRAKTMMITVLMYSLFTGLSSFSQGPWDFAFYRFLTGLGVGGEFAVGVALVAEVMPGAARPYALALLQALSGIGNVSAAFIFLGLGVAQEHGWLRETPGIASRFALADHVSDRRHSRLPGPAHHAAAQGAGALGTGQPRRSGDRHSSVPIANCSESRACASTRCWDCFWDVPA